MHSFVYELARTPVRPDCYARAGNLPDCFTNRSATMPKTPTRRNGAGHCRSVPISWGPSAPARGDRLDFAPNLRDSFFRRGYVCFRACR